MKSISGEDHGMMTTQSVKFDRHTIQKARLTVCRYADNAAEAEEWMWMIGLHPKAKP